MTKENRLLREARKQARNRALLFRNCECEYDSHDHPIACPRKLRARYYLHWKPDHPHLPDADNIMVVCSTCHSYILSAQRRIY